MQGSHPQQLSTHYIVFKEDGGSNRTERFVSVTKQTFKFNIVTALRAKCEWFLDIVFYWVLCIIRLENTYLVVW